MGHILKLTVRMQRGDDNMPWGFRMTGGADSNMPLSVQKVNPGSMAEEVGLIPGDLICAVGDPPQPSVHWSHAQAQNAIKMSGNYLVMTVQRGGGGHAGAASTYGIPSAAMSGPNYSQFQNQNQMRQASTSISQALGGGGGQMRQQPSPSSFQPQWTQPVQSPQQQSYSTHYHSQTTTNYGGGNTSAGPPPVSPKPGMSAAAPAPGGNQPFIAVQYENQVPVGVQHNLKSSLPQYQPPPFTGHNKTPKPFGAPRPFGAATNAAPNKVQNLQYNSPAGLYSQQNFNDTFQQQAGAMGQYQ